MKFLFMTYNFVESDLVQINENLNLKISHIGEQNHQIIIIDNFLQNPEYLLEIIKSIPIEKNLNNQSGYGAGWHSTLPLRFSQIKQTAHYLAINNYNMSPPKEGNPHQNIYLQTNILHGGIVCNYTSMLPHVDDAFLGFNLFLNKDDDCKGGTMFYSHVKSGLDSQSSYFDSEFSKSNEYWKIHETYRKAKKYDYEVEYDSKMIDEDPEWEKSFLIEAKYNRFVMYPSSLFHSAYIEKDWYQDEYRVSLAGFIT